MCCLLYELQIIMYQTESFVSIIPKAKYHLPVNLLISFSIFLVGMVDDVDADADSHCCLSFCLNALPAI